MELPSLCFLCTHSEMLNCWSRWSESLVQWYTDINVYKQEIEKYGYEYEIYEVWKLHEFTLNEWNIFYD